MEYVAGDHLLVNVARTTGYTDSSSSSSSVTSVSSVTQATTTSDSDDATRPGNFAPSERACDPSRRHVQWLLPGERMLRLLFSQLARAIGELHKRGLLHRDVKPSNILVTPEGRAVLIDFGIIAELTHGPVMERSRTAGTVNYMAPEQFADAGEPSLASDWYALGVVLFQALCGRTPFIGTASAQIELKQTFDAPLVHALQPDAPDDLASLCQRLLSRAPDQRPDLEAILEVIQPSKRTAPREFLGTREQLFGRDAELALLGEALARAHAGESATVLVSGSSGMGKSVLVEHFLNGLDRTEPTMVLRGRCYEQESVPYKALDSSVDALCHALLQLSESERADVIPEGADLLASVFPVLRRIPELKDAVVGEVDETTQLQSRAFAALAEIITLLGETRTVILWIDDLHWGDADSVPMLSQLVRLKACRLMLIASYRDDVAANSAVLASLMESLGGAQKVQELTTSLRVGAVADETLHELALSLLDPCVASEELVASIVREAKGSPYFANELARHANSHARSTVAATSLDTVIVEHAAALTKGARTLLEVLCIAGWKMPRSIAEAASGTDQRTTHELLAARLTRTTTSAQGQKLIEPYHDRVREAVIATLGQETRRKHHRRIAYAIEEVAGAAEGHLFALAQHYALSEDVELAERTHELNRRAAESAVAANAFEQAYRCAAQAHAAAEDGGIDLDAAFLVMYGDAASRTGRMETAGGILNRALELSTDSARRAAIHVQLAKVSMGQLDSDKALGAATSALAELKTKLPKKSIIGILLALFGLWWVMRRLDDPAFFGTASGAEREKLMTLNRAFVQIGYACYFKMDTVSMVLAQLRPARAALRIGNCAELVHWFAMLGVVSSILGKRAWSDAARRRARTYAMALQNTVTVARADVFDAIALHFLGHTVEAQREMEAALEQQGELLENQDFLKGVADLSWNLIMRGHPHRAWAWIERALARTAVSQGRAAEGHTYRCYAGPALAMIGRGEDGAEHLRRFRELVDSTPFDRWRTSQLLAHSILYESEVSPTGPVIEELLCEYHALDNPIKRLPQQMKQVFVAQARARLRQLEERPGDADALASCKSALDQLKKAVSHPTLAAHHLVLRAAWHRLRSEPVKAEAALEAAEEMAERTDNPWVLYDVAIERAAAARDEGDDVACASHHDVAMSLAAQHGWASRLERARST